GERKNLASDFCEFGIRCLAFAPRASLMPIETLHLIRKRHALARQRDLKRIAFDLTGNRAADHQIRSTIVRGGTENNCRAMTGLLAAGLRVEADPDDVSGIRHISPRHVTDSLFLSSGRSQPGRAAFSC